MFCRVLYCALAAIHDEIIVRGIPSLKTERRTSSILVQVGRRTRIMVAMTSNKRDNSLQSIS